jgi:Ca-activated chloride channel family protein
LLLLPIAALAMRQRAKSALLFPVSSLVHDARSRRSKVRARMLGLLRGMVGLCLVFGLSGPRWRNAGEPLATEGIAIGLVLDVSASMATEDFRWQDRSISRLAGAQKVFHLLVAGGTGPAGIEFPGRPHDLISLVSYATRPETDCPLTLDHAALLHQLDRLAPRTLIAEATSNPGDALALALAGLRHASAERKVLVFLTDGESNVPPPALTTLQAGQVAASLGIPIYTIDALDAGDTSADALRAHETLESLAKLTGGRYFRASDGAGLGEALSELDRFERTRLVDFAFHRDRLLSPWLALAALVAWCCLLLLEGTLWRRLP